jgi:hypothetical protein
MTFDAAFANHPLLAFLSKISDSVVSTVSEVFAGSTVREKEEVSRSSSSADLPLFLDSSILGSNPLSLGELPLGGGSGDTARGVLGSDPLGFGTVWIISNVLKDVTQMFI